MFVAVFLLRFGLVWFGLLWFETLNLIRFDRVCRVCLSKDFELEELSLSFNYSFIVSFTTEV